MNLTIPDAGGKENMNIFVVLSIFFWLLVFIYWIVKSRDKGILNEIAGLAKLFFSGLVLHIPEFIPFKYFSYKQFFLTQIAGLLIISFGVFICIWARECLSQNWSGKVIIQREHALIKNGPYKIIRHPIYSGVLIMMFGSSIIIGNILGFIWVLFCFIGLYRKSKQEEDLLEKEFGKDYNEYKMDTKMIIPKIL